MRKKERWSEERDRKESPGIRGTKGLEEWEQMTDVAGLKEGLRRRQKDERQ